MKKIAQRYVQNNQEFYSMVLPFKDVFERSEVLVYGDDSKFGYQRPLDVRHSKNIKKSIINEKDSLPTSIILSVNKNEFEQYIKEFSLKGFDSSDLIEVNLPPASDSKLFRIVDGQHRIYGLKEAAETDPYFENFPLNVIILTTKEEERVNEVIIFRDINSKAKKIRTDLTLLAIYNYELIQKKGLNNEIDLLKHLLIRTVHTLNESKGTVWYKAVQFDIHQKPVSGVIGVAAMVNSLKNFVLKYIEYKQINFTNINQQTHEETIKSLNEIADDISKIINVAWEAVRFKWKSCFLETEEGLSAEVFDKTYYLQKTTGANAIHTILENEIAYINNQFDLTQFKNIISDSPLKTEDWAVGGILSGLTSQSGFKTAENLIRYGQPTPPDKNDTNN